jgi:hypothetical protein
VRSATTATSDSISVENDRPPSPLTLSAITVRRVRPGMFTACVTVTPSPAE